MKKIQLNQYKSLKKEIESEGLRLKRLQEQPMRCERSTNALVRTKADKAATAAKIASCEIVIKKRIASCMALRKQIEEFICNTPDSYLRRILTLRYIEGLKWSSVAQQVNCVNQKSIEMLVERYLRKAATKGKKEIEGD